MGAWPCARNLSTCSDRRSRRAACSTCWTTKSGPIRRSARPVADDPRALVRILIVDDDPDVREVIELTLGGQGYDVTSVGGGQAALAQLARETFDLIVCDLGMPEVDGIALYGALQRRPAPRPVVLFLSGFQDNARYETFLRETGVPRLVKPFEIAVLRGTVRRLLGRA